MPDRKYDRDTDRQALLSDLKARIIDLTENRFSLPETGIYDEPVRYFKANLKWTPIIFGFLDWLEDVAGWQEAEDDSYPGIQQILIFEEGIEPLVTTQAELKAAICEGLTCWSEEMSKRILSGKGLSFSVDENGEIVVGGADGDSSLPEDDPLTPINEKNAAAAGGAIALRYYLNALFADLKALYGNGTTTKTPVEQAQTIISSKYAQGDPANMEAAVAEYYANTELYLQQIEILGTTALDSWIYCKGYDYDSLIAYVWQTSFIYPLKLNAVNLIKGFVSGTFLNVWIDGQAQPSTAYLDYSCVPSPTETLIMTNTTSNFATITTWKANHRLKITATGKFVDSAAPSRQADLWWYRDGAGVLTFRGPQVTMNQGAGALTKPTTNQVPYRADNTYVFTVDLTNAGSIFFNLANPALTAPLTGSITLVIQDLGEFLP